MTPVITTLGRVDAGLRLSGSFIQERDLEPTESTEVIIPEIVVESAPLPTGPFYSKDLYENTALRFKLLSTAIKKPELRGLQWQMCRNDILYWVNCYVSTYNPRKTPSTIPFITYEYEDKLLLDLVESIRNQKDLLIDKSRDMGVTWCVLLALTWFWQFHGEGQDFLVGSRKEQYIDVMGNMDTIIEKVRFIIRNQPKWLLPKGFDWKTHSNYMKIVNPDSKATITGEATNNNFSRGGRRRAIFFDEFAFWECDQMAWRASADSTNCRIVVSTPCGFNNQFAKLRHGGSIEVRSLHWTLHPEKDKAWYDNECKRRNNDAVEIAQELDINYEGSEEGVLFEFAELKKAVHNQPNPSKDRIVVVCDPAGEGEDEAVFYVSNNGAVIERKFISKSTDPQLATEAFLLIKKHNAQVFEADSIGNSVVDLVVQLLGKNEKGVKCIKFKSSEKALNPLDYYNRRDEVYHKAAQAMKSGNVAIDDDYTLMRQLNATKYLKENGRLYVTPKEQVKELVSSSPDRADAWVLIADALARTHSMTEVIAEAPYRGPRFNREEIRSDEVYGNWGDNLDA